MAVVYNYLSVLSKMHECNNFTFVAVFCFHSNRFHFNVDDVILMVVNECHELFGNFGII